MEASLISGERFVFTTKKHWAALITDSGWAILMVLGSFALAWVQPDNSSGVLGFFSRIIELIRLGLVCLRCVATGAIRKWPGCGSPIWTGSKSPQKSQDAAPNPFEPEP